MNQVHGDLDANRRLWNEQFRRIDPVQLAARVRDPIAWLDSDDRATSFRALVPDAVVARLPGAHVLEIGAGTSGLSLVMAELGAHVTALDIAAESARVNAAAALELGIADRLDAVAGDLVEVLAERPRRSFDLVVCQAFWHHLTHDLEARYMPLVARVVTADGEVRSFEPAVNSRVLDALRWTVPVKGRPSILQRDEFRDWKSRDSHPARDNSARHYRRVASRSFADVEVTPYGGVERLHRFVATGVSRRQDVRRRLVRVERHVPRVVQHVIARSQLIVARRPIGTG